MGLLDDMAKLLGGQAAGPAPPPIGAGTSGMTPDTTASPSSPPAPPAPIVLARIPRPAGSSSGNPLGLSPAIGGSDLGVAMSGLRQVDPHASRFGAFAQGLAGALSARSSAAYDNQRLALEQRRAALDDTLKGLQINSALRTTDALEQVARMGPGQGGAYPAGYTGPGAPAPSSAPASAPPQGGGEAPTNIAPPSQTGGGVGAPAMALPPQGVGAAPATANLPGQQSDPSAPAAQPIIRAGEGIAGSQNFWMRVDPETNPYFLRYRASIMDAKAAVPGLPADVANNYSRQAQQDRQSAHDITQSHMVMTRDGRQVLIPGALDAETTQKAAIAAAEKHVAAQEAFRDAPGMTASGTKYMPNPDAPASAEPTARGQAGQQDSGSAQTAALDPATANVRTAIPVAPRGGGYPIPADLPAGAKMTELGPAGQAIKEADKPYFDAMGNGPALDQTIEKFQSMSQAFKLFESGSLAEKRQAGATLAAALGATGIAKKIQDGDPAAYQWVEKEGAPLAMNQLKAVTNKFTQAEFKTTYGTSVPSPEKMPQANHQMIAEGLAQAQMQKQFNSDWQLAQTKGWASPSAFYQAWVKANPPSTFIQSAQRQLGNFRGMDLPKPKDWTAGVTYAAPKEMTQQQHAVFDKYGLKPGGLFKFNGWDNVAPVAAIAPDQGFSSYLEGHR